MIATSVVRRSLQFAVLLALSPILQAQERALALGVESPDIKWGPCPDPLPKGCQLAVLHGDPAKPNADVLLKVPGGSTVPLHTHTSAERMILVAGKLNLRYEGQEMAVLRAGSYAYGPAKMPHSAACASRTSCVLFIAFESPVDITAVAARAK
ncbi:cupin domain-containing protein [Massilia sp. LjRoot122]|uniref:cupin domain-containing protein n=1 Tax=Massilia sp. LjRoot122 TaxID=3342257 RepID=UPI003ECC224C